MHLANYKSIEEKNYRDVGLNEALHVPLTLLHSERPKLHRVLAFLSAIGLNGHIK